MYYKDYQEPAVIMTEQINEYNPPISSDISPDNNRVVKSTENLYKDAVLTSQNDSTYAGSSIMKTPTTG